MNTGYNEDALEERKDKTIAIHFVTFLAKSYQSVDISGGAQALLRQSGGTQLTR